MKFQFGGRAVRLVRVLALVLATGGTTVARAAADHVYSVHVCGGGADHVFAPGHIGAGMHLLDRCPFGQAGGTGITIETVNRTGRAPNGTYADQVFTAPVGTSITKVSFSLYGDGTASGWRTRLETSDGHRLAECPRNCHAASIDAAASSVPRPVRWVRLRLVCVSGSGCPYSSGGKPAGRSALAGATFRLTDRTDPKFIGLGGPLAGPGWHRGVQSLSVKAVDGSGIRQIDLLVQGRAAPVATWKPRRLSTTSTSTAWPSLYAPIPPAGISAAVNTALLPNGGPAWVALRMIDGVGNQSISPIALRIDNAPPVPPVISMNEKWLTTQVHTLSWTASHDRSGVTSTQALWCWANLPTACRPVVSVPKGTTSIPILAPSLGDWLLRMRFQDGAGNVGAWSAAVHVRFDNVVPGIGMPRVKNGWFNADEVAGKTEPIDQQFPLPVSGVAGYAVTIAYGASSPAIPGRMINSTGNQYALRALNRTGVWHMASRAISMSGLASSTYGTQDLLVDVDRPMLRVAASTDLAVWHAQPVSVGLVGSDPAGGSGMGPAPIDRPVTTGAYVTHSIDGGVDQFTAGDQAVATIMAEGVHTVRSYAADVAGNHSLERTVTVRIDRTPPETIMILPLSPSDPRRISVAAHDALSGVTSGEVQIRRQGTSQWLSMPTSVVGGQLAAEVSDDGLPDGMYDVRALARDAAGNVSVGSHRHDGSSAVLTLPLRVPTQLIAGKESSSCRKHKGHASSCAPRIGLGGTVRVAYGQSTTFVGVLQTTAQKPLSDQQVTIARRLSTGGAFVEQTSVRTDRHGRFRFRAFKGPSRSLRFSFPGSNLLRSASSQLRLAVSAHSTITVNHSRIHAGRTVRLSGRLGGPLPAGPVVVLPEAYFRGGWHPVGKSTTADSKGRWSMPYSFLPSTRGSFAFRVEIPHQAGYPYEGGHSRTVWVRVV